MEKQEFCIRIDDKEIKFIDDEFSKDSPSPFEVMMDFVPVFYAYKYIKEEVHDTTTKKNIENLSTNLDYINHYYRGIKDIEQHINPSFFEGYLKFIEEKGLDLHNFLKDLKEKIQTSSGNDIERTTIQNDEYLKKFKNDLILFFYSLTLSLLYKT